MDTTIIKGMRVLEALTARNQTSGISELARELNLNKSNVQRVLGTLLELGYVTKDPVTSRYAASLKMWEFGTRVLHRHQIKRAAQGHLRTLYDKLNETIFLCVGDDGDILYLDKMESAAPVRISSQTGFRAPAVKTASGKAILAFQGEEGLNRALTAALLHFNIVGHNMAQLGEELAAIRRDGYAISQSGFRQGVNSIAAPIRGRDGMVIASIAVTGPFERMGKAKMIALAPDLINTATRISEAL